jgi:glycosyltransferase involved in cell wall biosynthesis
MNGYRTSVLLYAALLQKKIVAVYHDVTMICPKGDKMKGDQPCTVDMCLEECIPCLRKAGELKPIRRLFRPEIKTMLSHAIDANVCTSRFSMEEYRLANKHLIQYGIDTDLFVPADRKKNTDPVRLLFVGRLVPEKGCQLLLQALRKLRNDGSDVVLSVCGDGTYRSQLEALTKRLDLRDVVTFHGELSGQKLINTMQEADISVVPSLWEEQFGLTAAEAMSCGLPVVGSLGGGLQWIVKEGGLGFERGDLEGLTRNLDYLISHPEIREKMGRQARQLAVEKYSLRRMNDQHMQLIESLMETESV